VARRERRRHRTCVQQIGRYQVLEEIARGGMGVVYKARSPSDDAPVAIKVMLGAGFSNPTSRKRFEREAEALSRVQHPNVVRILGSDVTPSGEPYMVMELVEGSSLQRRLDHQGPLDPDGAAEALVALCEAVAACHRAGVLHRDLKPDNVLVTRDGVLKLTDFGLVRDTDPSMSRTQLSKEGDLLGTPGFWAPEQAFGQIDAIGPATDVYGLGGTLFALLTGRPPHEAESLVQILAATQESKPAPSSLAPGVPGWLDAVAARALAVEPRARYPDAAAMAEALAAGRARARAAPGAPIARVGVGVAALVLTGALLLSARSWPTSPAGPGDGQPEAGTAPGPASGPDAEALVARSMVLYREGDLSGAIELLDDALRMRPDHAAAYRTRARVCEDLGDWGRAVEDYTEAIRCDPDDALAFGNRGSVRLALGDPQGALEDFSKAIGLRPDLVDAHHNRARLRAELGDPQGALEDCNQALRLQPDHAGAYLTRGLTRAKLGDAQGAVDDYTEAIRARPDFALAYCNRSRVRSRLGDHEGAMADAEEAIRVQPDYAEAHARRGLLRERGGDSRGAITAYTEAIRLDPDLAMAYYNRGLAWARLGEWQRQLDDCNETLRLLPDSADAYVARANARGRLGDTKGALADCDQALRLEPDDVTAWINRGLAQAELRRYDESIEDLQRALQLEPQNRVALSSLQKVRQVSGERDAREEAARKARAEEAFARGRALVVRGGFDLAVEAFSEALELWPGFALAWVERGAARWNLAEHDQAMEDYDEAIGLDADCTKAYWHRGYARFYLGELAGAVADFERVLELDPGDESARRNLEQARRQLAADQSQGD
jgi:tetratricopeptide (TPR) repeat protein/predicted Ser/Thr protein kinase